MVGYFGFCNFETEKYYLERISDLNEEENIISLKPENIKDQILQNEKISKIPAIPLLSALGPGLALSTLLF